MMKYSFNPEKLDPEADDLVYAYCGKKIFFPGAIPRWSEFPWTSYQVIRRVFFGRMENRPCWAVEVDLDQGDGWLDLRDLYFSQTQEEAAWAGRGSQILLWDRNHSFCGVCGTGTEGVEGEWAKTCPGCGMVYYPRISPAVIVLIHKGDQILLAHNSKMPEGLHSVIAGFVESGETLEEAVVREVREEVGLEIHPPVYFTSQAWPFPDALMVGFTAQYKSGEPRPDGIEITEANWFSRNKLPNIPRPGSIAGRLIDYFWGKSD